MKPNLAACAEAFARDKHARQFDKAGRPYCDHKWGDSCRCCANGAESPVLIAARAALTPVAPETQPEPSHVNQAARLEQPR
jgi:hypothetical protein